MSLNIIKYGTNEYAGSLIKKAGILLKPGNRI